VFELVEALMAAGAARATVTAHDYVFEQSDPLAERLFSRLASSTAKI
jgi:hypothetical protein